VFWANQSLKTGHYKVGTGEEIKTFNDSQSPITIVSKPCTFGIVAFSLDGQQLAATLLRECVIGPWDVTSGTLLKKLYHLESVNSIAFSSDGQLLAAGSDDKRARMWDPTSGNLLRILDDPEPVTRVAFSPNGQLLVSASNFITLRDAASGRVPETLEGHTQRVKALAISPDGHLLVSISEDITVRLWS